MAEYNFDVKIVAPEGNEIGIDTLACYGYFTRRDGSEGGGLWFNIDTSAPDGSNRLELYDYDGMTELPKAVVTALRSRGILLDETFD
jgi:hypothetical protein